MYVLCTKLGVYPQMPRGALFSAATAPPLSSRVVRPDSQGGRSGAYLRVIRLFRRQGPQPRMEWSPHQDHRNFEPFTCEPIDVAVGRSPLCWANSGFGTDISDTDLYTRRSMID